jgi:ABC-type cobalamin/Fe3+-siderophores transport system ATPase subunit
MSWMITRLSIVGIKGVLDRAGDFDLAKGQCLALYAPNGCGKSGYADAIEYLFSTDGTVAHLGKGSADSECGGKHAIPHVLATDKGIVPGVSLTLRKYEPASTVQIARTVRTGRADDIPVELAKIIRTAPAHRVLRQHDLRRFVVEMGPRDKYTELSRWLGQEHLERVLAHLTTTEEALKKTDPDREIDERTKDISKHTNQAILGYDQSATLLWCANEAKRHLGTDIAISSTDGLETNIQLLKERRDDIIAVSAETAEPCRARQTIHNIAERLLSASGPLGVIDIRLAEAVIAAERVDAVREIAKESIFQEVWESANRFLPAHTSDHCPVCLTPWAKTHVGSQETASHYVARSLGSLANLTKAQSDQKKAAVRLAETTRELVSGLREISVAASKVPCQDLADKSRDLANQLNALLESNQPLSATQDNYRTLFHQIGQIMATDVPALLQNLQGMEIPASAKAIDETIERIRALKDTLVRLAELQKERAEYRKVEGGFASIAKVIQARAATLVNEVVALLRDDVHAIYHKIHPTEGVPSIHLAPDTKSKTLLLRVDFHSANRTVPPAGYLSEAQINTLGLALFVSSARLFNREFPFIVLDDIVSSYDADNRGRIVDVVAEELKDFQVFLTTHDERFYWMLKSRLCDKGWKFERITGWTFGQGPRREADMLRPDQITKLIQDGDPQLAGNAVRQYMEEWLDDMCAKYEAYTMHKRGLKDFNRTLFELWGPFIKRLTDLKGSFFGGHIKQEPCYDRLSTHALLNYYSHAQANPYEWAAIGDVQYVWAEFQAFQKLFQCSSCPKVLKYDRDAERLYCPCGGQIFATAAVNGRYHT